MPQPVTATRLLVVDDHRKIRQPLAAYLRRHGHVVDTAEDAAGMRALLRQQRYDAVVLDAMLPDGDGFALCHDLHVRHALPVILLTARGEREDRIRGLQLGADDYVVKPFDPAELLARLQAVLRRSRRTADSGAAPAGTYRFAGRSYRTGSGVLVVPGGDRIRLTGTDARLLEAFLRHPRRPLSRDTLLGLVSAPGEEIGARVVDRQVSRLRRKLGGEDGAGLLRALWGDGYQLAAEVETDAAPDPR